MLILLEIPENPFTTSEENPALKSVSITTSTAKIHELPKEMPKPLLILFSRHITSALMDERLASYQNNYPFLWFFYDGRGNNSAVKFAAAQKISLFFYI